MVTTFTYQFCEYTQLASPKNFAYMDQTFFGIDGTTSATVRTILTDHSHIPASYNALIEDGENQSNGVTVTHDSDTVCTSTKNYQLTEAIMCDDSITGKGDTSIS